MSRVFDLTANTLIELLAFSGIKYNGVANTTRLKNWRQPPLKVSRRLSRPEGRNHTLHGLQVAFGLSLGTSATLRRSGVLRLWEDVLCMVDFQSTIPRNHARKKSFRRS